MEKRGWMGRTLVPGWTWEACSSGSGFHYQREGYPLLPALSHRSQYSYLLVCQTTEIPTPCKTGRGKKYHRFRRPGDRPHPEHRFLNKATPSGSGSPWGPSALGKTNHPYLPLSLGLSSSKKYVADALQDTFAGGCFTDTSGY